MWEVDEREVAAVLGQVLMTTGEAIDRARQRLPASHEVFMNDADKQQFMRRCDGF